MKGIASFTSCIQGLAELLFFFNFLVVSFVGLLYVFAASTDQSYSLYSIEDESCQYNGCVKKRTKQIHLKTNFI
jgi:hypothetical protein